MKLFTLLATLVCLIAGCAGLESTQGKHVGTTYRGLPACEGADQSKWNNCATEITSKSGDYVWTTTGEWRNGKKVGRSSSYMVGPNEPPKMCEGFTELVNGVSLRQGRWECIRNGKTYYEVYVDGGLSQEKTMQLSMELSISEFQKKCEVLGFTKGTDAFAECSLRLMELAERNNGPSQLGQQEYNRIQQQNTDAQRLEGLKQMLEGLQQGIDATKPKTQRTDAACVQKCLSDGSMMSYCKSFCSY